MYQKDTNGGKMPKVCSSLPMYGRHPIIRSPLDTDQYKLTQQWAVLKTFPDTKVRYTLIIRTKREFPKGFAEELRDQIENMATLEMTLDESAFLKKRCPYLPQAYHDFLRGYQFDPNEVEIVEKDNAVELTIEGYWYRTILWETPIMATISELFFRMWGEKRQGDDICDARVREKAELFESIGAKVAEFGARRRYSLDNQDRVVGLLKKLAPNSFTGTSNPYLAMKYDSNVIGTQAHEWYMVIAALFGFHMANQIGMEKWVDVYQGSLGIALTDTFTTDAFFRDFTQKYAKLFDGVRQDSGDPVTFAQRAIAHYKSLGIDPMTKSIIFSDSLNPEKVKTIHEFCRGKIKDAYGIGTNLSNDVGVKPLNIVIKVTAVNIGNAWVPTVKLSDDAGKHTGPDNAVNLCKDVLRLSA